MKSYKSLLLATVAAVATMIFSGCGGASVAPQHSEAIAAKKAMYTQTGMWYDTTKKNRVMGTNYAVGVYLPANSKVTMEGTARNGIVVNHNGTTITLYNVPKYTGVDINGFIDRTLGDKPLNLAKLTAAEKKAMKTGKIAKGMSKEAVRILRGYPPSHVTPSLDQDRWTYWRNRFAKMHIEFSKGKVSNILGQQ
jgi:hypothetical protein